MGAAVKRHGKDAKVTLGANTVLGIGNWDLAGITTDEVDASEFGDEWKSTAYGMKDGGTISFAGIGDPSDTTGQEVLISAQVETTDITNIRLYVGGGSTSYYEPCRTTGYLSPNITTGAATVVSHVNVTSISINASKDALLNISFDCKVSGVMVLI